MWKNQTKKTETVCIAAIFFLVDAIKIFFFLIKHLMPERSGRFAICLSKIRDEGIEDFKDITGM